MSRLRLHRGATFTGMFDDAFASAGVKVVKCPAADAPGELLCGTLGTDRASQCTDQMLVYGESHFRIMLRAYAGH